MLPRRRAALRRRLLLRAAAVLLCVVARADAFAVKPDDHYEHPLDETQLAAPRSEVLRPGAGSCARASRAWHGRVRVLGESVRPCVRAVRACVRACVRPCVRARVENECENECERAARACVHDHECARTHRRAHMRGSRAPAPFAPNRGPVTPRHRSHSACLARAGSAKYPS